jgi:hypothetical protein
VVDATSNDRRQSKGTAEPQLEVGEVPTAGPHVSAPGEEEEKGKKCDALGFHPGSLTLTIGSNELTLVKQWSTWVITLKTSPPTPNDSYWSTLGQVGQNPSQNPLTTL